MRPHNKYKDGKESQVTAPSQESVVHIPAKVLKNILDFLSPTDGLKTVTISKATLTYFGSYIVQRLQNEKFKYKSIQTGMVYNLALYQDGSIYAWGNNELGQLGLGHTDNQTTPQSIDPNHFPNKIIKSIHVIYHNTFALMTDDSLYAWGDNLYGQLGLGHRQHQNTPQLIDPSHFHNKTINSIHLGYIHTLALMDDGSLYAWGGNDDGQLGLGHINNQYTPQLISPIHFHNKKIKSINIGGVRALALMDDGSLYAWGNNNRGQLGLGHNSFQQNTPQLIDPSHFHNKTIKSIHKGISHTLALMDDDTLYTWGLNDKGQLGLGHNTNQNTPQLIDPSHFHNKTIKSIHKGSSHTLALMDDDTLYTWGLNDKGQLGLGHNTNQNTPQLINHEHFHNKTIQSIHLGFDHILALMDDDSLYSWGYNGNGELGLGHTDNQITPQLINPEHFPNKTIQSIHVGTFKTFALMTDGSLFAWGFNRKGQLGLGHNNNQYTPQKIEGRLEKAFRLGHENLVSLSMFSDKSLEERINLKHQLLSLHIPMADDMEKITEAYAQGSPSAGQT